MKKVSMRACVLPPAFLAALVVAAGASAHAHLTPTVALAKEGQLFSLNVPTEKDDASAIKIELVPPDGFSIDSFVDAPGWKRAVQQTGSGEDAAVERVTWSGGSVPPGGVTNFQFLGSGDAARTYTFEVRQTYSDGSVADWSGDEASDTPAPSVELVSSLGGGGGTSKLAVIALVVGALGAVLGAAALLVGTGRRPIA